MGEAQKVTPAALGGFIFGLGSTVASMALPQAYPGFPVWGWQMLFWGGGASMAMSASVVAYEMILRPKLQGKGNLVALGLTIFFALGFLASGAWYIYGRRADNIAAPAPPTAATPPSPSLPKPSTLTEPEAPPALAPQIAVQPSPPPPKPPLVRMLRKRVDDPVIETDAAGSSVWKQSIVYFGNPSSDQIKLRVTKNEFYVDGRLVSTTNPSECAYLSPGEGVPIRATTALPIVVPQSAQELRIVLSVTYDTVPGTGLRTTGETLHYKIHSLNPPSFEVVTTDMFER